MGGMHTYSALWDWKTQIIMYIASKRSAPHWLWKKKPWGVVRNKEMVRSEVSALSWTILSSFYPSHYDAFHSSCASFVLHCTDIQVCFQHIYPIVTSRTPETLQALTFSFPKPPTVSVKPFCLQFHNFSSYFLLLSIYPPLHHIFFMHLPRMLERPTTCSLLLHVFINKKTQSTELLWFRFCPFTAHRTLEHFSLLYLTSVPERWQRFAPPCPGEQRGHFQRLHAFSWELWSPSEKLTRSPSGTAGPLYLKHTDVWSGLETFQWKSQDYFTYYTALALVVCLIFHLPSIVVGPFYWPRLSNIKLYYPHKLLLLL